MKALINKVADFFKYKGYYREGIPLNEQVLVGLFQVFTWYLWALFIASFYTHGVVVIPEQMKSYYTLLLSIYVGIKEFGRWKFHVKRHRHGLFFLLQYAITAIIFFYLVGHNKIYHTLFKFPADFLWVLTEITIFYAGTFISKGLYAFTHKKELQ